MIRETADALVAGGFAAAGYNIVWVDDAWASKTRGPDGALVPDPARCARKRAPCAMTVIPTQSFGQRACADLGLLANSCISTLQSRCDDMSLLSRFLSRAHTHTHARTRTHTHTHTHTHVEQARWPVGLKPVVDYVHSKGLLFGLYGDIGTSTCAGYPGLQRPDGTFTQVCVRAC
jgi:hypothetical protein